MKRKKLKIPKWMKKKMKENVMEIKKRRDSGKLTKKDLWKTC